VKSWQHPAGAALNGELGDASGLLVWRTWLSPRLLPLFAHRTILDYGDICGFELLVKTCKVGLIIHRNIDTSLGVSFLAHGAWVISGLRFLCYSLKSFRVIIAKGVETLTFCGRATQKRIVHKKINPSFCFNSSERTPNPCPSS
jgi:hypothetical protein